MGERRNGAETSVTPNPLLPHSDSDSDIDSEFTVSDAVNSPLNEDEVQESNLNDNEYHPNSGSDSNNDNIDASNQRSPSAPSPQKRAYTFINRVPNPRVKSKMRKRWKADLEAVIEDVNSLACCKKLRCFENCNDSFLRSKMSSYRGMSYEQRKLTLIEMKGSTGKFFFDGKPVCNKFLKKAFRFGSDIISEVRTNVKRNRHTDSFGSDLNSLTTSNSDRGPLQRDAIITCLERMAESCGDKMPDVDEIHLPFFRKRDVYVHFKQEFRLLNPPTIKCPCKSYFYSTWKAQCRSIKVRKLGRFAKCTSCEQLRRGISDALARRDYNTVTLLRRRKAEHNDYIARERREYKKKRDKAKLQPDQFLSIIVDGADQSAFGLPHFMVKTKDDRGHSLKVRLIGLLEHNQENRLRLFTLTEEYPTGANHVIEAIHRFLTERINQSSLPRTFYIQVDNCTKENKNRFFFSYLESLIRWKLFDEIVVGFLPVGHTHEDIDQTFSRTSDRLRCNDAMTLEDLHGQLRHVYNSNTSVCAMNNVANWSGLCEIERCLTNVKNFSKFRYFKFYRLQETQIISCMISVGVTDDWMDIQKLSPSSNIKSFTKFAPDLRKTPPLIIKCPEGKEKITECITSAESRITSVDKVDSLISLRDKVFKERTETFHWNIDSCVELNLSGLLRADGDDDDDNDDAILPAPMTTEEDTVNVNYRYELNSFVAVKPEDSDGSPFWLAKINHVHLNDDNIVTKLKIHWFDREGDQDVYISRYFPSYNEVNNKKRTKRTPMRDEISVDSVLINFTSLTRKHRLPASVAQHLRSIST